MEQPATTDVQPLSGNQIPLNRFNMIGQLLKIATNTNDRSINNIVLTLFTPYGSTCEIVLNDLILKQYRWMDSYEAMESIMGLQDVICKMAFYYKKMNSTSFNLGHIVTLELPCCVQLDEYDGIYCKEYFLTYEKCIYLFNLILKTMVFVIHQHNIYNFGK